jgi:hypothetical protein
MKLDFLINGSPNDAFFSQIAFFRLALNALGGAYRNARLVAVLGRETTTSLAPEWAPYFENIVVEWTDPYHVRLRDAAAETDRRFKLFRPDADLVILCDADTVLMRPLSDLAAGLAREPAVAGVVAHYHFPWHKSAGDPLQDWRAIAKAVLGREIPLVYPYTLDDSEAAGRCPFYINFGFFAAPPALMSELYPRYRDIRAKVQDILGNAFAGQVGLSLAIFDLGLPKIALPMRFNFPNDPLADVRYADEMQQIVMLHYLRTAHFDRQKIFTSADEMAKFFSLDLEGSNRIFQSFVLKLTDGRYPFDRAH